VGRYNGFMTLKIMNWNVWYSEKADNLVEFIKKINPDILCCQELTVNFEINPGVSVPDKIADDCGFKYYFFHPMTTYINNGEVIQMGNGIFSKFPITKSEFKYIQEADPKIKTFETENRTYIESELNIDGKELNVGTVHMSYAKEFDVSQKKYEELQKLIEAVNNHHERFILAGDMNALPESVIIKELEKLFIHADPNTDKPTWTTKPFSYQGFEANELNWRLDYIFATEDINVIQTKILQTKYSDHLPVLAEIEI
jgi:endonuclease/exonuclease/phosphatase family metal-dependent hydrolase